MKCTPLLALILGFSLVPFSLQAAERTFTGSAVGTPWSNDANWLGGESPEDGDSLLFTGSPANRLNNPNDLTNLLISGITFDGSSPSVNRFALSGNAIRLSGDVVSGNSYSNDIGFDVALQNHIEVNTTNAAGGVVFAAGVSGAYRITKSGSGTLTFFNAGKTFTGGVTLQGGVLQGRNNPNPFGTGGLMIEGGTLDLALFNIGVSSLNGTGGTITNSNATVNSTRTLTIRSAASDHFEGAITDGAVNKTALIKESGGTLELSGISSHTGNTTVTGGTLLISGALQGSAVTVRNGATLASAQGVVKSATVEAGGSLAFTLDAGASPLLTLDTLTLGSNADLKLTFTAGALASGPITLIEVNDSYENLFATVNGVAFGAGNTFELTDGSTTHQLQLVYGADEISIAAIPEPRLLSLAAVVSGLVITVGRRRSRLLA